MKMSQRNYDSNMNIRKVKGACKRFGLEEIPEDLKNLVDSLNETIGKAVAVLPEDMETTLPGGEIIMEGEYAIRLSEVLAPNGGKILVFTAPELNEAIRTEHARKIENQQLKRDAAEAARKEDTAIRRLCELEARGVKTLPAGVLEFLKALPELAKIRYDGARARVQRIIQDNNPEDVTVYGDVNGEIFAVALDRGGWLQLTIFVDGLDYINETVRRLSMTADEADEIARRKDYINPPAVFDRPIPEDILRKIAKELPHDRNYIPYHHVCRYGEAFDFAKRAVKLTDTPRGGELTLILQGVSPVDMVTIDNYYDDGTKVSGLVPVNFDDEQWAAFVNPRNGAITVYCPEEE